MQFRPPSHQPAIGGAREGRDLALHFREVERIDRVRFHTERRRYGLDHRKLTDPGASRGIPNYRRSRHVRRYLLEQFHPFCGEAVFKLGKAGNVAAGPGQTFDEARAKVDDLHNTIGMVRVACIIGATTMLPEIRMTLGASAIISAASLRIRSASFAAQR